MSTIEERVAALESALASMTAAEKRIVELPAASSVANDDFVALDGVANGSRRFAASNLGGKAEVMTEAEWDDLPDDKYTDNKVYVLTDAEPPESQLFEKVGSASLDTSADNLSDAINEHESDISTLNSNLGDLKFISIVVNGTTTAYGNLTINNPTGSSAIFLLRNTYTDSVNSSFGVINVESTSTTSINLRFRTLSDGTANANAQINTTLIFAYR